MKELPLRQPGDGEVSASRCDGRIAISVTTDGESRFVVASDYNAARVLVALCIMLEVPIPKALGKMRM